MNASSTRTEILEFLKRSSESEKKDWNASEIAEKIGLKRNTASELLNDLAARGLIYKRKSRPVTFSYLREETDKENVDDDPFSQFIGAQQSLKDQIEKCRLSANYPNRGMPVLLLGESGVGKSLLAEYIYKYACYIGAIKENAPFVVLNCADYANNKELLSSLLFGYKKGAFTGAVSDTEGLIEKADNGYLFLDEVHRLPPEGQEKLFRYIDKGVVSKMGDSSHEKAVNVRLIFATTEEPTEMLDTFLRRIPISIYLPNYENRTLEERYQILCSLFSLEAKVMHCVFLVSSNVINCLLKFQGTGNIGTLKNIIKLCCVKSYSKHSKEKEVPVLLSDLDEQYQSSSYLAGNLYLNENIRIDENWKSNAEIPYHSLFSEKDFSLDKIEKALVKYKDHEFDDKKLREVLYREVNMITERFLYKNTNELLESLYRENVKNILRYLQDNYGLQVNGTMQAFFTKLLLSLNNQTEISEKNLLKQMKHIEELLQSMMYHQYKMGVMFQEMVRQSLDYEGSPLFTRIMLILYIFCNVERDVDLINAVIICHGYSTASSMAHMVNRLYGKYIFDAFDMPYETPTREVVKKVKKYLKQVDTSKGVLIFVDIGSLVRITDELQEDIEGDFGMVNNITTQMALQAGEMILKEERIETIINSILKNNSIEGQYFPRKEKPRALILETQYDYGSGMLDMLRECCKEIDITVLECKYDALKKEGQNSKVFQDYNVLLIIATSKLEIRNQQILYMGDLLGEQGEEVLRSTLGRYYSTKSVEKTIHNIIVSFTMRNLVNTLTILHPDKILTDVEQAVSDLELYLGRTFSMDVKRILYVHLCIMVERLITEKGKVSEDIGEEFLMCREDFADSVKKAFSVVEDKYNVHINGYEMQMIYNIIEN